jgi:hypothetical protein
MAKSNGWTYDSELGWVHCSAYHDNGVDGSQTFYHYESDGARRVIKEIASLIATRSMTTKLGRNTSPHIFKNPYVTTELVDTAFIRPIDVC